MTVAAQETDAEPVARASDGRAVCVDLDGTLLRIDTLHESAFSAIFQDWRVLFRIPGWRAAGNERLRAELAARWTFDPETLPYDTRILDRLRAERDAGRRIVLYTAADRGVAERIARHLGLFDEIIARGAVRPAAEAQGRGVEPFDDREPVFRALLRAMRPYQWVKNALCFVPPVAAGNLGSAAWLGALAIAVAFCLIASGIYILNDLSDLAADRAHPRKSQRPFASGAAPIAAGLALAPVLILAGLALGVATNGWPALILYLAVSLGYTVWLKEKSLLDVFALAALYAIRVFGGGEASGHPVSLWLLAFSLFLFLSLALVKRVSELRRLRETGSGRTSMRRGYTIEDIAILEMFGVAATFASALVLSLYVQSTAALSAYGNPTMLWGAIPLLLFWQCQLWLSTARGQMHDDPILFAARDRASWVVFACLACIVVVARLPTMGH